jgi:hypothetical protein
LLDRRAASAIFSTQTKKELAMALQISVSPDGEGWAVRSDLLHDEMTFDKGARAEAAARVLADNWARSGRPAEVRIFLRDGSEAGTLEFPAAEN